MAPSERALRTRRRIVDAAFDLFAARGWEGTTMAAVAGAAGVAPQTMYFAFGSKPALLQAVLVARRTAPGESGDVVAGEWYARALAARDQRRALALGVEGGTEVLRRLSPLALAVAAAEIVDEEFARVMRGIRTERREGMSRLLEALARNGGLAVPVSTATDVLDVVQSMGTYHGFVAGCGWSPEAYKAWAFQMLTQLLPTLMPARAAKLDLAATAGLSYHEELAQLLAGRSGGA